MSQPIEELQNMPYWEIINALADVAPRVLGLRHEYNALLAQQRALVAARELISANLRIGDKVRIAGRHEGRVCPLAVVVGATSCGPTFQLLDKKGQRYGDPCDAFLFEGYEKI